MTNDLILTNELERLRQVIRDHWSPEQADEILRAAAVPPLRDSDLDVQSLEAPVKVGQYVYPNRTTTAVRVTHIPSQMYEDSYEHRSQPANKQAAIERLAVRVNEWKDERVAKITAALEATQHIAECSDHPDHLADAERKALEAFGPLRSLGNEVVFLREMLHRIEEELPRTREGYDSYDGTANPVIASIVADALARRGEM